MFKRVLKVLLLSNLSQMLYSTGHTGRVINMDIEDFLSLTDDEVKCHTAYETGYIVNNPFTGSILLYLEDMEYDDEGDLFDAADIQDLLSSDSFGEIDK